MNLFDLRKIYHSKICQEIIFVDKDGIPNMADRHSTASVDFAQGILQRLGCEYYSSASIKGQTVGRKFEQINQEFLQQSFDLLQHLRPGNWLFDVSGDITQFQQYSHISDLAQILDNHPSLKTSLGTDYLITPDVVVARYAIKDTEINEQSVILTEDIPIATLTPARFANQSSTKLILHASISIKWTLRSDRAQNARTEALNLIRNRKGHTPHIVAVTAEPMPSRLASLALGTGDLDCIYHFALPELREAIDEVGSEDSQELIETMIGGNRLRDIADLPFDLIL